MSVPVVLVCRQAHPRIGDSVTLEQLNEEKFTFFMTDEPGVTQLRAVSDQHLSERKFGFRSDSFFSLINMISASNLLGYIPEIAYKQYRDTLQLKKIDVPFSLPDLSIYMMYNRTATTSRVFSSFIDQVNTDGFNYD